MKHNKLDYTLYLVTDRALLAGRELAACVAEACRGGVTLVQLREKELGSREFYEAALELRQVTRRLGVPLIINDRLDIALAVEADGLHVGQEDLPLPVVRRQLGSEAIVGVSVHTLAEALQAQAEGADYVGIGSLFPTHTKVDASVLDRQEVRRMKEALAIPAVGIGGISAGNLRQVRQCGLDGAAVVSAILGQDDVAQAARQLRSLWAQP